MRFTVQAAVGNGEGVYDAAYDFGSPHASEGGMSGDPEAIGAEVTRFLGSLTPKACEAMRYSTSRFFVELVITPEDQPAGGERG